MKNSDGSYSIRTKVSNDASCIEVNAKSTEAGANIQEWEFNGGNNQNWYVEKAPLILGDINNDGVVDSFDMVLMRKELVSKTLDTNAKERADVNLDGIVTVADAEELQKFILTGKPFTENSIFYAVDMKIESGVTEDINSGFKGSAYVNLDNKVGSNIEWDYRQIGSHIGSILEDYANTWKESLGQ